METKHTKGEWEVTQMLNVISKNNGKMICATQSNMNGHEIEANAKLIASAPELLEALMLAKKGGLFQGEIGSKAIKAIDNAINKATNGNKI